MDHGLERRFFGLEYRKKTFYCPILHKKKKFQKWPLLEKKAFSWRILPKKKSWKIFGPKP